MQEVWERIEAWLAANAPEVLAGLNPGSADRDIAETEAFLGVEFPQDVRECYRRHDGQGQEAPGLLPGGEFLSLQRMCDEWGIWKSLLDGGAFRDASGETNGPVRDNWWNPAWIPLTYDGAGNHYCLDFDPAEGGNVGQVIRFWHDDASRVVVAPGLTAWLDILADGLDSGEFVYDEEDYYGIVSKHDL